MFDFVDIFGIFWINSIDSVIPVPQSQATQSPTLWKQIESVTNQLKWKTNWIDSINFAKNESIQINQLSRTDWYTSLLTTNQISAQSLQCAPFPRYGKGGTSARAHVRTCQWRRHGFWVGGRTEVWVNMTEKAPEHWKKCDCFLISAV